MAEEFKTTLPAVTAGAALIQEIGIVPTYIDEYSVARIMAIAPVAVTAQGTTNFATILVRQMRANVWTQTLGFLNLSTALAAETPAALSLAGDSGGTGVTYAATTLTDATKAWVVNQWTGRVITVGGVTMTVVSNTATVLTGTAWSGATPAAGAAYTIAAVPTESAILQANDVLDVNVVHTGTGGLLPVSTVVSVEIV